MKKDNATNIGKIKNISSEWYVPQFTPNISNQAILSKQILSKIPPELHYVERSFLEKS